MDKCTNTSPTSDKEKWGPETPGMNPEHELEPKGNKPNGEKHSSDGKGHYSGH